MKKYEEILTEINAKHKEIASIVETNVDGFITKSMYKEE